MKRCKKCGKPIEDWAEVCPECTPLRMEEVIATVFYVKDGRQRSEDFTDGNMFCLEDAIEFFNQVQGHAKLVVKDPLESWRCVRQK